MQWYKIELTPEQMANRDVFKLQDSFDKIWLSSGNPDGFALFHDKKAITSTIIYVSPIAATLCQVLLKYYKADPCNPPSRKSVGFFLGNAKVAVLLPE